jgi:hypothetical protein
MWLGIGAGVGLLKSQIVDRPKEERQRKLAAETQRYSPWTGLQAQQVQEADPLGNAMQFGVNSGMMGQGIKNQEGAEKLRDAQVNYLNRNTPSPQSAAAVSSFGGSSWGEWPAGPVNGYGYRNNGGF